MGRVSFNKYFSFFCTFSGSSDPYQATYESYDTYDYSTAELATADDGK